MVCGEVVVLAAVVVGAVVFGGGLTPVFWLLVFPFFFVASLFGGAPSSFLLEKR